MLLTILFSFVVILTPTYSARILGIVSTPSYSHQIVFQPLWKELSLKGHQVTVLTTDPMNDPTLTNLTEVDMSVSYVMWNKMNINEMAKLNIFELFNTYLDIARDLAEEQLLLPEVQKIINSETKFDLLMMELIFPSMAILSEKFKCPLIQLCSLDGTSYNYHLIGNPSHPILNPDNLVVFTGKPNFFQRLASTLILLIVRYMLSLTLPMQDAIIKNYLGNDYPPLEDILKNTSMMFVNTDNVFHTIRPLLPSIIQFGGGTHFTPPKPLPKDLQMQLDNANGGFIYFSLGSNIKSERLSESTRQVFLETFSELPYTILWKFENDDLAGKPDNVIVSKWFPQQDIFRHPNIKLFISQGGLQSMEEAIYNHIPIVGIPFFGDQHANLQRMVSRDMALSLDHASIDKTSLKAAILEVINNPKYRNKVKELAELAMDRPMTGLERAVWWTEYVIRHKGATHLRSPALDLPDYQYFLLDVIAFCLVAIFTVIYILVKLVRLVWKLIKYFVPKSKTKIQ